MKDIKFNPEQVLKTEKWFSKAEIEEILNNVEYIIMAEPNFNDTSMAQIHFTIFLNTQDVLPKEVINPILEKFSTEYKLKDVIDFQHQLADVAFAKTNQETPMPYHKITHDANSSAILEDAGTIKNYIFDFNANAIEGFNQIRDGLTGWSYVYE